MRSLIDKEMIKVKIDEILEHFLGNVNKNQIGIIYFRIQIYFVSKGNARIKFEKKI